ncbi:hypothetical protein EYC84_011197 [Monilinia fructicola]|uniref:Dol-P-Glc:Glc(2)Man(9)GlcNAc(2)-PP-Dol alpha-1,2-glucosyltransferase n=1 Tax=Monilinia fructicola TaxID=38448 RepID=A0A5M9J5G3_MONFR|nr:hypothetical protein EYC84_011197 [Monilinia fructicola]
MAGAITTLFVGVITAVGRSDPSSREGLSKRTSLVVPLAVASLASFWEYQVTKNVPEPYLDEVFHIPQAQAYCRWQYGTWDPKLTTPPGLYWWSHFLSIVSGFTTCNPHFLRITNVIALTSIIMLAWKCRTLIIRAGVEHRRDLTPRPSQVPSHEGLLKQFYEIVNSEHLHDPHLHATRLEDFILTPLSVFRIGITRLPHIILQLIPHISLLITFATFVYINGGVVLGDKTNHVATIHLPNSSISGPSSPSSPSPFFSPPSSPPYPPSSQTPSTQLDSSRHPSTSNSAPSPPSPSPSLPSSAPSSS